MGGHSRDREQPQRNLSLGLTFFTFLEGGTWKRARGGYLSVQEDCMGEGGPLSTPNSSLPKALQVQHFELGLETN